MAYVFLAIAIVAEVIGTSALNVARGFTRPGPTAIVVIGYGVAFYCLSLALKTLPVAIAYAIWSGVGIALITVVGWIVFKQRLDTAALAGLGLIVAGVLVIQLYSSAAKH